MSVVTDDKNPFEANPYSPGLPLYKAPAVYTGRALIGSLFVMLPWPLLGIAACQGLSLLEAPSEAVLMFGGATMFLLLPLGLLVNSEWIFSMFIGLVWLVALFWPVCFRRKSFDTGLQVQRILVCQSVFSAIQAGLGFLLVLGKQC